METRRFLLTTALLLPVLSIRSPTARAEDNVLPLMTDEPKSFETYLGSAPPSGATLGNSVGAVIVGARVGQAKSAFEPQSMRMLLGPQFANLNQICVKILSKDGRYFAQGRYKVEPSSGQTPTIAFSTKYAEVLAGYAAMDIATYVTPSQSCKDREPLYLVNYTSADAHGPLVLQLRAGEARVHVQMGRNDNPVGPVKICEKVKAPSVGFTHECIVEFKDDIESGSYQLAVGETDSDGKLVTVIYTIIIPGASKKD